MKYAFLTFLMGAIAFATYLYQQNDGLSAGSIEGTVMQSMDNLGGSVSNSMEGMSQKLGF
jgi:hypothetical protein